MARTANRSRGGARLARRAQSGAARWPRPTARLTQAALFSAGPLLIIAGAGTGKTNTLAHRVAHLILNGVAPERLLLLTFSRRAAQEMIQRAQRIVAQALAAQDSPRSDNRRRPRASRGRERFIRSPIGCCVSTPRRSDSSPASASWTGATAADLMDLARQDLSLSRKEQRFPRKDTCLAIYSHCVNTRRALERTLADVFPWCAQWHDELKRLFARYVDMKLRAAGARLRRSAPLLACARRGRAARRRTSVRSSITCSWTSTRTRTRCRRRFCSR